MSLVNVGAFGGVGGRSRAWREERGAQHAHPTAMFRACRDFSSIMFGLRFKFYRTVTLT